MQSHPSILLLDDSPGECELFRLALAHAEVDAALHAEHDTEAALDFLRSHFNLPSIVILDWHLQNQFGDVFLKHLRTDPRLASIPVVVFTTSDDASDLAKAYASGTNGYVVKPGTFDDLVQCVRAMCKFWIQWNHNPAGVVSR